MKRNRMMRIASFLLIAVLATTCAISGTFAKYTQDFSSSSVARVAKWDINLTDGTNAADFETDFKLFESILDTKTGEKDDEVAEGSGENIIAPGTKGSVVIYIENASEVDAEYSLVLTETVSGLGTGERIPIKYRLNGAGEWVDNLATLNLNKVAIDMNGTTSITLEWVWAFEVGTDSDEIADNDEIDTTIGSVTGDVEVTVNAKLTVTQRD